MIAQNIKYFLDSDICSYIINGKKEHIELQERFLQYKSTDILIPSIVVAELNYGIELAYKKGDYNEDIWKKKLLKINKFLSPYKIINFDRDCAIIYANIKASLEVSGKKLGSEINNNDYLIASIVLVSGGVLITNNDKHFERIENLKIDNWLK